MDEKFKEQQAQLLRALETKMNEVVDQRVKGLESAEETSKKISEAVGEAISKANEATKADIKALEETVVKLNDQIAKMEQKGLDTNVVTKFDEKLNAMFESSKFQDFMDGHTRKSGAFEGFCLKDIVSMTDDYVGNVLITQQQNTVVNPFGVKKLHMRDVLTTLQGDPAYPNLAFAEITDLDRNARYVTENGRLPESSFKVKENQVGTKRLGTYIQMSKRMLKSRVYVRSFILAMLPEAVLMAEDWNILYGDGNGENLEGLVNKSGVHSVEDVISTAVVTGVAGSVKSASPYNGGKDALVEFSAPHAEIIDGMKITFAKASTNTGLNATHDVIKVNDRQILLRGVAMSGEEAGAAAMTFTVNNGAYKSVVSPNSLDVIKSAFAVMNYAQYNPTAIIMNPITVNAIESEKDTQGRNLDLIQVSNGVKTIGGRPIVEYAGVPADKYLIGDFGPLGAALVDYTSLTLEWAEDVESKLTNSVYLIAQEEIIFPIYNPWAFAYGSISALKTAITQ